MTVFSIQPIVPKKSLALPDMAVLLQQILEDVAKEALAEYKATVRTWSAKPTFFMDTLVSSQEIVIGTDNQIYEYVDKGTKPHTIEPVRASVLRFNSVYKPKTRVRQLQSVKGGSSPPVAFAMKVEHPGTKAREFTTLVSKRAQKRLKRQAQKQINKALKKGGF